MAGRSLLGLDLGSTHLKAVELDAGPDGPTLTHMADRPVPAADQIEGGLHLPPLLTLREEKFLPHAHVASFPYPNEPEVDFFEIPDGPDNALAEAIRVEVSQVRNLERDEVVADFTRLGPESAGGDAPRKILAIHATRESVESTLDTFARAQLDLALLEAKEIALISALLANYEFEPNEPAAVIDIGGKSSCMVVGVGGELRFAKRFNLSALDLNEMIRDNFGISEGEAEDLIPDCEIILGQGENLDNHSMLSLAANGFAEKVVGEIQLASDFCMLNLMELGNVSDLQRLYLAGGMARLPGLAEFIAQEMEIEVETMDPLRKIEFDFEILDQLGADEVPHMAVAVGLALHKLEGAR